MKTLILIGLLFISPLHAQQSLEDVRSFLKLNKMQPEVLSIYQKQTERFRAPSLRQVVEDDFDTQAGHIDVDPQELSQLWKNQLKAQGKSGFSFYDFDGLYQFNLEAAHLWRALMSCQRGDKKTRAIKARIAFFQGDEFCVAAHAEEQMKQRLVRFHQQILNFLSSTQVNSADFHRLYSPSAQTPSVLQVESVGEYNAQENIMPKVHPLLVQSLLNILVTHYPFVRLWPKMHYGPLDRTLDFLNTGVVGTSTQLEVKLKKEYQDRAQRFGHLLLKNMYKAMPLQWSAYKQAMVDRDDYDEQDIVDAKVIHNIIFLFVHMPLGRCEDWGLWPGLTQSLARFVSDLDHRVPRNHTTLDWDYFPASVLARKTYLSCGPVIDGLPEFYLTGIPWATALPRNDYSDSEEREIGRELVEIFREMADHYLD